MWISEFILLEVHGASWMFIFISFIKLVAFSVIIIFKYSLPLSLLLHRPHNMCTGQPDGCPTGPIGSVHFNLFSFCSSDLVISIVLSSNLLLLPLNHSDEFFICYCIFQLQNFFLVFQVVCLIMILAFGSIIILLTFCTYSLASVSIFDTV